MSCAAAAARASRSRTALGVVRALLRALMYLRARFLGSFGGGGVWMAGGGVAGTSSVSDWSGMPLPAS